MLRLLLRTVFGGAASSTDDDWAPVIEAAIEKAVDGTDPRLRAVHRYKDRLREPVRRAARVETGAR